MAESSSLLIGRSRGRSDVTCATFAVINLAAAVDSADASLLHSVFRALEADLQLGPSALSSLSLLQALSMAVAAPVWGVLSDTWPRRSLLSTAVFGWAISSLLNGCATGLASFAVLRALNGVALAVITPLSFAMIADMVAPASRGMAFGLLTLSNSIGAIAGSTFATSVAGQRVLGFAGWRLPFFVAALLALLLVPLVRAFVPHGVPGGRTAKGAGAAAVGGGGGCSGGARALVGLRAGAAARRRAQPHAAAGHAAGAVWRGAVAGLRLPHDVPAVRFYRAFPGVYAPPCRCLCPPPSHRRYSGLPDTRAALVASCCRAGTAAGGFAGGMMSDRCHRASPAHGRIWLAQLADLARLPIVFLLFGPRWGAAAGGAPYAALLLLLGFLAPWVGVTNKAILADAVPARARASAIALSLALEGAVAACVGAPAVAWLAEEVHGYTAPPPGQAIADMAPELRSHNARALSAAMFSMTFWPWLICCLLYSLVHCSFAADCRLARQADRDEGGAGGAVLDVIDGE